TTVDLRDRTRELNVGRAHRNSSALLPLRLELGAEPAPRIGAKRRHLARKEVELLHGELDRPLVRMAFDIGIEHGGIERAFELVGLELRHVDPVGGEAAERLVERSRHVAHAEHEARYYEAVADANLLRFGG